MHAKSDSDVTSFDQSSPRSPPKRSVYYVQSPSRDSHDGDNNSPVDSPLHQSYGHHSRASSASRVSGSYNSSSTKKPNNNNNRTKRNDNKDWPPHCKVIQEDRDYDGFYHDDNNRRLIRRTQLSIAVLGFVLIFTLFCLIIWGVGRNYRARLRVESLRVYNFYSGEGSDDTGVQTKMVTTNCSVKMSVYNPATFFGIYVSSNSVNLMYSEIAVATGELEKFHLSRNIHKTVSVNLQASKIPLYGAGANFAASMDKGGVPMVLDFEVKSRGNIVGKLVKSKHRLRVSCSVTINPHSNKLIIPKKNACKYG